MDEIKHKQEEGDMTKNKLSKLIFVGVLVVIVAFVILMKNRTEKEKDAEEVVLEELQSQPETLEPTKKHKTESVIQPREEQRTVKIDKDVIAVVNNFKITKDYFEDRYQSLPPEYKSTYGKDKEGFLTQLIVMELLYQEAGKKGLGKDLDDINDIEQRKEGAIEKLIADITEKIQISETEMKSFYNAHISEMRGASFEQVKPTIKNYLIQQKQGEVIDQYIEDLKNKADIVKNEEWIKKQQALRPKNPLDVALKSRKPTVLDLGAGYCVPCKMMKPIFAELEKECKGKANIILLEISGYRELARKYRVRVIPTQIFFDKDGKEYWRHEGFLSKDKIVEKLKELGAKC